MRTDRKAGYCALLYGHDEMLMKTRGWLLNTIGCESILALSMRSFRERTLSQDIDLVVMCQTTSPADCSAALEFATEHMANARIMVFFHREMACEPGQQTVVLDAAAGPAAFLDTARRMLAPSGAMANA